MSFRFAHFLSVVSLVALPAVVNAQDAPVHLYPPSEVQGPAQRVVNVDCTKGEKISRALQQPAEEITINIHGICTEDVLINRNNVTLAGSDPSVDGLRGDPDPALDAGVVTVDGAVHNFIQKLSIGDGLRPGITAQNGGRVFVTDCDVFHNAGDGAVSLGGMVVLTRVTLENNIGRGLSAWAGGDVICTDCTVSGSAWAVFAATGGRVVMNSSNVSGTNRALAAGQSGYVEFDNGVFSGSLDFESKSTLVLHHSTQTALGTEGSYIGIDSSILAADSTALVGPLPLDSFSNLTLRTGSSIQGDLMCTAASLAFCANPGRITGNVNSCGSACVKP